jgi:nucleoside-diphosphate-sugar epimerase
MRRQSGNEVGFFAGGVSEAADPIKHVILTGASGYIGSRLVRLALAQGRIVTVLGRTGNAANNSVRLVWWALGDPLPTLGAPVETTAVIHLAHDWQDRSAQGINVRGTRILLQSARSQRVKRFVFVSSQSARSDALNAYGRMKWAIEQGLDGPDAVSARVGLVYGGARRGMYGLMTKLVPVMPLLPMVDPGRLVQPIHVDEVCRGLLALVDGDRTGWIGLAGPDPVSFGDFLKTLAQEGFSVRLRIFPIPLRLALLAAEATAAIPFCPTIDKERILGLAGTQPIECRQHLDAMDLVVRPLRTGLRADLLGVKVLLSEARVVCSFALGKSAGGSLLRRYARAVHAVELDPGPVLLPRLSLWRPVLLRFFEPFDRSSALARRLRLATALSAMSRDALVAADTKTCNRFTRFLSIVLLIVIEIAAFPCRLLFADRS